MDEKKLAAALRAAADAIDGGPADVAAPQQAAPPTEKPATGRGRGRPPKAAAEAPAAPAQAPAEEDPFETAPAAVQELPPATLEQVREALKALQAATDKDTAVGVLKSAGGVATLTDLAKDKYAAVAAAARAAVPQAGKPEEEDPFEAGPPAAAGPPPTLEQVRAEIVATQKRTSQDTVQKLVMEHGGKSKTETGFGPSLKALPAENYAKVIAALKALPTTK